MKSVLVFGARVNAKSDVGEKSKEKGEDSHCAMVLGDPC